MKKSLAYPLLFFILLPNLSFAQEIIYKKMDGWHQIDAKDWPQQTRQSKGRYAKQVNNISRTITYLRTYTLLATVLIFATGGHLVLVGGFIRTFQVAPLAGPDLQALGGVAIDNIGWFFVAAIEIAFPVVAVLLMVELLLGLVARAAPQTNVLTIGFALKTGVVIISLAIAVPLLPAAVESVVQLANGTAT